MGLLDFLFGNKNKKIQEFMTRNAIIIDVRTKAEFEMGAIPGSKNKGYSKTSCKHHFQKYF